MNDQIIDTVIKQVLDHAVKPGDHAGQSGHLAYVSYSIKDMIKAQLQDNVVEIACNYEKDIVNEFTWEPDNPSYKYYYEKKIIINLCREDNKAEMIDEENIEKKINRFIESYLLHIEHDYGENRAPVRFPPYYFYETLNDSKSRYYCFIDVDLGINETLAFVSGNAETMLETIKSVFGDRFGMKITPENL